MFALSPRWSVIELIQGGMRACSVSNIAYVQRTLIWYWMATTYQLVQWLWTRQRTAWWCTLLRGQSSQYMVNLLNFLFGYIPTVFRQLKGYPSQIKSNIIRCSWLVELPYNWYQLDWAKISLAMIPRGVLASLTSITTIYTKLALQ